MHLEHSTSGFITRHRQSVLCGALAGVISGSVACGGEQLEQRDLGNTANQLATDEGSGDDRSPVVIDGTIDPFVAGHWVGSAEDLFSPAGPDGERPTYTFPSGSTQITLDIVVEDGAFPSGQITFGAGPVPEPEAGVVYPPGFQPAITLGSPEISIAPIEGFSYALSERMVRTASDVGVAAGTLALSYSANAAYEPWCALQPARPRSDGEFDCLTLAELDDPTVNCSSLAPDGETVIAHYDCVLDELCSADNICRCNERGCTAAYNTPSDIWLTRQGDELIASFARTVFDYSAGVGRFLPVGVARFQRVEE